MKVLSLSLTAIVLAFSSAVSASDFEEDKQYIACRKSASTDRQLIACQERLLERLNMSIAKALDRNMTLLTEGEKQKALRYQSQWESLISLKLSCPRKSSYVPVCQLVKGIYLFK
ncbi:hypothetical protein [Parasutterella sp.]|uniref:hypothetical protein n=1 Tax=Parasutterella sp. TaxID=2049037 RepID=UPI003AF13C04